MFLLMNWNRCHLWWRRLLCRYQHLPSRPGRVTCQYVNSNCFAANENRYFDNVHLVFPIVHKNSFLSSFRPPLDKSGLLDPLAWVVFLAASSYFDDPRLQPLHFSVISISRYVACHGMEIIRIIDLSDRKWIWRIWSFRNWATSRHILWWNRPIYDSMIFRLHQIVT